MNRPERNANDTLLGGKPKKEPMTEVANVDDNKQVVYGKFIDEDDKLSMKPQQQDLSGAAEDSDTGVDTCRDENESSAMRSHSSLLSYMKLPEETTVPENTKVDEDQTCMSHSKNKKSHDSNASTVSFDTWAFAISDSRTVVRQQNGKPEPASQASMKSDEVRKAEELASEWLNDKKVVRFNLDKNEVFTQQP